MFSFITKIFSGKVTDVYNKIPYFITFGVLILFVFGVLYFNRISPITYTMYNIETITYEKGTVISVLEEHLEPAPDMPGRMLGQQKLKIELKNGPLKGKEIFVENNLSNTHNILVKKGTSVIVKSDRPTGTEAYYTVYNYDRTQGLLLVTVIFTAMMILVGRLKGLRSVLGLGISLFFIIAFLLPSIFRGLPPVLISIVTVTIIAGFSILLLNGFSRKSGTALAATVSGILFSGLFFFIISEMLTLGGYNLEEAEELILVSRKTGLKTGEVMFAGILISSLGAVMDMTISVSASMYEIKENQPDMSFKAWFQSGMTVGRDMIGSMCQTLVLAFVGSAVAMLLTLMAYGTQLNQLMSSDYLAIEVTQGITGSLAVIIAVPVTAGLCVLFGKGRKK